MQSIVIFIFSLLITISAVDAQSEFQLFNKVDDIYEFSKEYNQLVSGTDIKEGDILTIGEYKFTYLESLGAGTSSKLLKVKLLEPNHLVGEFALRIPLNNDYYNQSQTLLTREFMELHNKGTAALQESGIAIADTLLHEKETFMLHNIVEHDFNLGVFLQKEKYIESKVSTSKVTKALVDFAKQTYLFENIADFHPGQLVYSIKDNKWTLLDWSESHIMADSSLTNEHIFNSKLFKKYLSYVYLETGELLSVFGFPATYEKTPFMENILDEISNVIKEKRNSSNKLLQSLSCQKLINSIKS